jgi:hypothetical protein
MHHPTEIDRLVKDKQVRYHHQAYKARRRESRRKGIRRQRA